MQSFGGQVQTQIPDRRGMRRLLRSAFAANPALTILGMSMLMMFVATLFGIFVDHRVITGAPAWLKPAKFAISVSIYCFTFVWMLGFVENRPRLVRLVANVTATSLIVEMVVILTQAARGTTSHFNQTTPLNTALWFTMGAFIVVVWTMNLLLAIVLLLQRMPDPAFAWSLRLGVLISAIGMAAAFFMVTPTPEQATRAGGYGPHIVGAHSVGVADGGPGLPVLGWSTVGGDLRVAHFVGLHALQVLPVLGWLLLTTRRGVLALLSAKDRLALVWTVGVTYLSVVLLLTWQAIRGQSVIHPDTKTLAAASFLAAAFGISVLITTLRVWNRNRRKQAFPLAIQILSEKENYENRN